MNWNSFDEGTNRTKKKWIRVCSGFHLSIGHKRKYFLLESDKCGWWVCGPRSLFAPCTDSDKMSIFVNANDGVCAQQHRNMTWSAMRVWVWVKTVFICIFGLQRADCTSILTPKFNIISFVSKWCLDINPVLATFSICQRPNASDRHISCGICIHRWDAQCPAFPLFIPLWLRFLSNPLVTYCSSIVPCRTTERAHHPNALHTKRTQCYLSIQLMPFCISA